MIIKKLFKMILSKTKKAEQERRKAWFEAAWSLLLHGASFEEVKKVYDKLSKRAKPKYCEVKRQTIDIERGDGTKINFECFGIGGDPDFPSDIMDKHKLLNFQSWFLFSDETGSPYVRIVEKRDEFAVGTFYNGDFFCCDLAPVWHCFKWACENLRTMLCAAKDVERRRREKEQTECEVVEVIKNEQAEKSVDGNDGQ